MSRGFFVRTDVWAAQLTHDVRFWHKADMLELRCTCPLSGVKAVSLQTSAECPLLTQSRPAENDRYCLK